jgi:hypothetical protein
MDETSKAPKTRQAEIAVRLNKSAHKPWYVHETDRWLLVRDRDGDAVCRINEIEHVTPAERRSADFIAHAPSDIAWLLEQNTHLQEALKDAMRHATPGTLTKDEGSQS